MGKRAGRRQAAEYLKGRQPHSEVAVITRNSKGHF
jgi:hypothetical protein